MDNTLIIVGYINARGLPNERHISKKLDLNLTEQQKTAVCQEIVEKEMSIQSYNYILACPIN